MCAVWLLAGTKKRKAGARGSAHVALLRDALVELLRQAVLQARVQRT